MDRERWKKISRIFDLALTIPKKRRTTYIRQLCKDDPELQQEIDELLDSIEESDRMLDEHLEKNEALLEEFAARLEESPPEPDLDLTGSVMGCWKLVQLLGHGGMGSVYRAERIDSEIKQTGALKIMHKNLINAENIRRFRLEQQIQAGLQHPHIASLIEGGVSEDGLPYLVMEYVEGKPLLRYCDELRLNLHQRLDLFGVVCDTVQFAHNNLIVHRDLKPENILVTDDGHVKILDFGIAKLLDPDLYEITPRETRPGLHLMSLDYAAPEQVGGETITTATDGYALGILLYELLTGLHPFDDFKDQQYRSVVRTIRETDPTPPSRKLARLDDSGRLREIAEARSAEPGELAKQLNGDLDSIVMKALRKEPDERYSSAEQLKTDLRRHTEDQPVLARGDSSRYRIKKFFKRHSAGAAMALLFVVVVASLVSYYTVQLSEERNEARLEAETSEQVTSFMMSLFEASRPENAQGNTVTAQMLLERGVERAEALEQQPAIQARMFQEIGRAYRTLGRYDRAEPLVARALEMTRRIYGERHPEVASSLNQQGMLLKEQGDYAAAESLYHQALEIQRETLGGGHPDLAESLNNLGVVNRLNGEYEAAEKYLRESLDLWHKLYGEEHPEIANSTQNLGTVLMMQGEFEEAEELLHDALAMERRLVGDRHPLVATILLNLALVIKKQKRYEEAEPLYRRALEVQREVLGDDHTKVAQTLNNLAVLLIEMDNLAGAEPLLREATEIRRKQFGPDHSEYVASLHNLAFLLQNKEDYAAADTLYQQTLKKWRSLLGPDHPNVAVTLNNLAVVRKARGYRESAERFFREALALRRDALGEDHPAVKRSIQRLVELYDDWNRPALAGAYRDTLAALE